MIFATKTFWKKSDILFKNETIKYLKGPDLIENNHRLLINGEMHCRAIWYNQLQWTKAVHVYLWVWNDLFFIYINCYCNFPPRFFPISFSIFFCQLPKIFLFILLFLKIFLYTPLFIPTHPIQIIISVKVYFAKKYKP